MPVLARLLAGIILLVPALVRAEVVVEDQVQRLPRLRLVVVVPPRTVVAATVHHLLRRSNGELEVQDRRAARYHYDVLRRRREALALEGMEPAQIRDANT